MKTAQTDPAFPDEGPARRLTKLSESVDLSGGFSLDISKLQAGTIVEVDFPKASIDESRDAGGHNSACHIQGTRFNFEFTKGLIFLRE